MAVLRLLFLKLKKVCFVFFFFGSLWVWSAWWPQWPTCSPLCSGRVTAENCCSYASAQSASFSVSSLSQRWGTCGREGVNTVTFLLIVFHLHSQSFFGPVGRLVLPSTLWPLRLQWQQPSPSVSVSIHSDRMDIWLVTFCALLFHFSCGIRIVASVRPAKIIPSGEKIFS